MDSHWRARYELALRPLVTPLRERLEKQGVSRAQIGIRIDVFSLNLN